MEINDIRNSTAFRGGTFSEYKIADVKSACINEIEQANEGGSGLSETFENVQNGEIKSESGFRVAMASQPLEEILMLGWLSRLSF